MEQYEFGRTLEGQAVTAYRLQNSRGAADRAGRLVDVVLGYDTVAEYQQNSGFLGAAIGRMANRVGKGRFALNGTEYALACNDGENHLHGGVKGFDKYLWQAEPQGEELLLTRLSPDGEEGYPGSLTVSVRYALTDDNQLAITYEADTDADTILNLTNHSYFNLNGEGTVLNHELQVFANEFTENDGGCLPTGVLLAVKGTPFDFTQPKPIGRDLGADCEQLKRAGGYDHNFVLLGEGLKTEARLHSAQTGITLTCFTTLPGMQVYSANFLDPRPGKGGGVIGYRDALCLETQVFPNAMACPHFPSPILRAGEHFCSRTVYAFEMEA